VLAERVDWGNMSNLAVLDMVLPNLQQLTAHRARLKLVDSAASCQIQRIVNPPLAALLRDLDKQLLSTETTPAHGLDKPTCTFPCIVVVNASACVFSCSLTNNPIVIVSSVSVPVALREHIQLYTGVSATKFRGFSVHEELRYIVIEVIRSLSIASAAISVCHLVAVCIRCTLGVLSI